MIPLVPDSQIPSHGYVNATKNTIHKINHTRKKIYRLDVIRCVYRHALPLPPQPSRQRRSVTTHSPISMATPSVDVDIDDGDEGEWIQMTTRRHRTREEPAPINPHPEPNPKPPALPKSVSDFTTKPFHHRIWCSLVDDTKSATHLKGTGIVDDMCTGCMDSPFCDIHPQTPPGIAKTVYVCPCPIKHDDLTLFQMRNKVNFEFFHEYFNTSDATPCARDACQSCPCPPILRNAVVTYWNEKLGVPFTGPDDGLSPIVPVREMYPLEITVQRNLKWPNVVAFTVRSSEPKLISRLLDMVAKAVTSHITRRVGEYPVALTSEGIIDVKDWRVGYPGDPTDDGDIMQNAMAINPHVVGSFISIIHILREKTKLTSLRLDRVPNNVHGWWYILCDAPVTAYNAELIAGAVRAATNSVFGLHTISPRDVDSWHV